MKNLISATNRWGDYDSHFTLSVLNGDKVEIIKSLYQAGKYKLAYISAIKYGLNELAENIGKAIQM